MSGLYSAAVPLGYGVVFLTSAVLEEVFEDSSPDFPTLRS